MTESNQDQLHEPVLLSEVLHYLNPKEGESFLDLTAGYGGHAAAILAKTHAATRATLVDRDRNAIEHLAKKFKTGPEIIHHDYLTASRKLLHAGNQFDLILADLGISSPHIDKASRGFSINHDGPLDMRMDQRQELSAHEIVNNYSESQLKELLQRFGEEPKAGRIAELIVSHRPLLTTNELANVVAHAWSGSHSKVHPATRTFQALRIAVNDELYQLESSLPLWLKLMAPGGRIAIISFHSLEDRLVKQFFQEHAGERYDAHLRLLTKRPVIPSANELVTNPRSRSAKLRAAVKIKTKHL